MVVTTKVFKHGKGQAVRLPSGFRFDEDEVCIKRLGAGVMLFPKKAAWSLMAQAIDGMDKDFMARRHQPTAIV